MTGARACLGLALLLWLPALASARDTSTPLTISEYIGRLDALASAVVQVSGDRSPRSSDLITTLPGAWTVAGSGQTFQISTTALRLELRAWSASHDWSARQRLLGHLRSLRADAALFEQPAPDVTTHRAQLAGILAQPEFQRVRGPTWLDRLEQGALELVERLFGRVVRLSDIPTITSIVVYALIAFVLLLVAWSAFRFFRRRSPIETVVPHLQPTSSREWSVWLADAQAAAARGDWRDAIHLTYWCAVLFLEGQGAWRPDSTRTPREYLRLLPASMSGREALAALTRRCEVVWYGTVPADAQAFTESIANLKQIGCPVA